MILITLFVLSLISTLILLLSANGLINEWYDFWIIIVSLIAFFLAYAIIFVLFALIYARCFSLKKEHKNTKFLNFLCKIVCQMILEVSRVKLNVRGLDKLKEGENFLLIQNHLSNYDPVVTIWALRYFKCAMIHKDSLLKVPFLNNALHADGHIAIDRSNNRKGLESIIKAIKELEETDRCIVVYPEGTRSKSEELAEFHHGTFKIAQKSQKPIVVTAILNTECIKRRFYYASTNVYLDIIDVLYYDDYKDMTTEELSNKVHDMIQERINELSNLRYKHK